MNKNTKNKNIIAIIIMLFLALGTTLIIIGINKERNDLIIPGLIIFLLSFFISAIIPIKLLKQSKVCPNCGAKKIKSITFMNDNKVIEYYCPNCLQ